MKLFSFMINFGYFQLFNFLLVCINHFTGPVHNNRCGLQKHQNSWRLTFCLRSLWRSTRRLCQKTKPYRWQQLLQFSFHVELRCYNLLVLRSFWLRPLYSFLYMFCIELYIHLTFINFTRPCSWPKEASVSWCMAGKHQKHFLPNR